MEMEQHERESIPSMSPQSQSVLPGANISTSPNFISPKRLTPLGSPISKVMNNMRTYLEDIGHFTKFNPQDAWLPITESRKGNAYYSAFHNLNAGIGFQALLLPVALTFLGWTWGILTLIVAYVWQLYTLWLLIRLHESVPGRRYNRYIELAQAAFGERLGVWLALFPVINLSAGTATSLISVGGGALKLFYNTVCGSTCHALTTVEWFVVFAVLSAILSILPNLNSIAWVSLIGAVMAVAYCTLVWTLSLSVPRPQGVSYQIITSSTPVDTIFSILNALGIVAFAFRGHNLVPEIQATMPSTLKHPAYVPMWRGAKAANIFMGLCYFPLAVGGYWAYGNKMLPQGILNTIYTLHGKQISRAALGVTYLFVVLNSLSSFQIYSMSVYDSFEASYTSKTKKPCHKGVRVGFRIFFVSFNLFAGVAFPFVSSFAGLLGGMTSIPVTFGYPCFFWLALKTTPDTKFTFQWYLNWFLGCCGIVLAFGVSAGGLFTILHTHPFRFNFFKP
eukprot:Gb_36339 [translate_table: standard]